MSKPLNSPKKILLADDSVTMHRAVKLGLKKEPFDVICCDNGQDAWRIIKADKPDAVLADLDMPGMTGAELCQKIKNDPELSHVAVILVCGSFDQIDEKHLESVPSDARLWKPFETHVLVSLLGKVLEMHAAGGSSPTQVSLSSEPTAFAKQAVRPPPPPTSKTNTDISSQNQTLSSFESTDSHHAFEPKVSQEPTRQIEVPSVSDFDSSDLLEGFQDIPITESDSALHSIEATQMGDALMVQTNSDENLWSSDAHFSSEPTQMPSKDREPTAFGIEAFQEASTKWGSRQTENLDDPEKAFSSEVFEAVENRDFENDRSAFEATEFQSSHEALNDPEETLSTFRETMINEAPKNSHPSNLGGSSLAKSPTHGSSLIDRTSIIPTAQVSLTNDTNLSVDEIRKLIREEIQIAISGWLKNKLHDELDRVIEDIDRE